MDIAVLQNQWFRDPDRARKLYDIGVSNHGDEYRRRFVGMMLFGSNCLTGRRILKAFGDEIRSSVRWMNASPYFANKSSGAFKPDPEHIAQVIAAERPSIVLAFGVAAYKGVTDAADHCEMDASWRVIKGPHPAARRAVVEQELREMATQYWSIKHDQE